MKKPFRAAAFIGLLGLATVSCMKENNITTENVASVETVYYSAGDSYGSENLDGDEAWDDFFGRMLALAREGYDVTIFGNASSSDSAKEVVTFTTTSEKEATEWAKYMHSQGYTVGISYNQQTGIYTCTATK